MLTNETNIEPRNRREQRAKTARGRRRVAPSPDAFAYTIEDGQALGLPGRTTIYKLFDEGKLKKIKVARRTLIEGDSLRALLRGAA
jgi:hypothetical protein